MCLGFSFRGWQVAVSAVIKRISPPSALLQTPVTAVTDPVLFFGETAIVNMVRRARKKALFEPGDTRQQWKGEAAASLV